ncbi:MAG: hypothetical protein F6K11_10425 [Leptolyngbya sp. SIO3F4]|nr:hypothetical protein [Leptolyngbya sp. SIO3F4]
MHITPPSVQSTVEDSSPQSGRVSKYQLFFLISTAAIASSLGVAFGSTLRFQMLSVGQTPLFKPQQDFPPLAEWPPQLPESLEEHDDFDTRWDDEPSVSKLVYNNSASIDMEVYGADEEEVNKDELSSAESLHLEELLDSEAETLDTANSVRDLMDKTFDDEVLPPVLSTNIEELDGEIIEPDSVISDPVAESYPWFNKRPVSETQFTDGPFIIAPDELSPSSDSLSD